jgi:predicted TIM-barrel fold metal-dependent hydrolase
MQIIDAHHHLWDLSHACHHWLIDRAPHIVGDYSALCRSYLIADLHSDAASSPYKLVKSVHVDAGYDRGGDPVRETVWLQSVAGDPASRGMPHGIVGYADLIDVNVAQALGRHAEHANCRGIRQILNHSVDNPGLNFIDRGDLMEDAQWRDGYSRLAKFNLSFDLQIWPWQMAMAAGLAGDFPDVPVIINHTGMPLAHDAVSRSQWDGGMRALAAHDHVTTKISGLGMTIPGWTADDIRHYVLRTIEIFGVERCMFASNFPVDGLMSGYTNIWSAFDSITSDFGDDERRKLFHDNAERLYRI